MRRFTINKTAKRIYLFFFLVSIVLCLNFPSQRISRRIAEFAKSSAYERGVILDIGNLQFGSINCIQFTELSALVPTKFIRIPISIDRGTISANIFRLLSLTTELNGEIAAYGGSLVATVSSKILGEEGNFDFSLKDVLLNKHPIISGLSVEGVLSGLYKGTVKRGEPNLRALSNAVLTIDVDKFNYSGGHRIGGLIEIPPISNTSLLLTLEKSRDTIWLKALDLISSLGEATGRGKCLVDKTGAPKDIQMNIDITLSDTGKASLGGYLALAAGTSPSNAGSIWAVAITGRDLSRLTAQVVAK